MQDNLTQDGILIKPLELFPGYGVTVDGRVWSCVLKTSRGVGGGSGNNKGIVGDRWQELRPRKDRYGYLKVHLRPIGTGRNETRLVHRLVCLAFLGDPKPGDTQVNHVNGKKENNFLFNLEWSTPQKNIAHSMMEGLHVMGSRHPSAKLTEPCIVVIRARYREEHISQTSLAKEYGVSQQAISQLVSGKKWSHVN